MITKPAIESYPDEPQGAALPPCNPDSVTPIRHANAAITMTNPSDVQIETLVKAQITDENERKAWFKDAMGVRIQEVGANAEFSSQLNYTLDGTSAGGQQIERPTVLSSYVITQGTFAGTGNFEAVGVTW